MAQTVQASEAKARLLQLLDIVERGETIVITRHGRPIARLEPEAGRQEQELDATINALRDLGRRNGRISLDDLLSARDEGRRF